MAKTLLQATNDLLTQVREVDSRGVLTSLTDSARQTKIDRAITAWNQCIQLLFNLSSQPVPLQAREADLVLEEDKRIYPLAVELIHLHWPLRHKNTPNQTPQGYRIYPYAPEEPDFGYMRLIREDFHPGVTKGRPLKAAITPTRRELLMDRAPTSAEAGEIYTYVYSKRFNLANESDTFPFGDAVVEALTPAAAELWRGDYHNIRDNAIFQTFLATAARTLAPNPMRGHW